MSSDGALYAVTYTSALWHAPPSLEYVSDSMEMEDHVPVYVLKPDYPEYLAPSDDEIPVEDQPLPADTSPIALSPGYIADSDPEEDEEDLADYPADGGDDNDDESSDNDDNDDEVEEDEEEEHLALADSSAVPIVDHVPSAEEIKPFETDESAATPPPLPAYRTTPRISAQTQIPIPFPSEEEVARLFALPTPPPSPLTLLSSPPTNPTYAQAPLGCRAAMMRATPSPIPLPPSFLPSHIQPPHTRAAMAQMRATAPSTYHSLLPSGTPPLLPIPLPAPSTSYRADIPRLTCRFGRGHYLLLPHLGLRLGRVLLLLLDNRDLLWPAQEDRIAVRTEIEILRRERLPYEQESSETRQAL
ncbi:hypothetical protein Tco_1544627, partial [Tanacetum coccineum]